MPEPRVIRAVTIGHGGATLHTGRHSYTTGLSAREVPERLARAVAGLAPYPSRPDDQPEQVAPGCLVIDCTPIPWKDLTHYSIRGPMIGVHLAPGTTERGAWGPPRAGADFGTHPDGSPVRGLDEVAPDVQAELCTRFGGTVTDALALAATVEAPAR